MEFAVAIIVSFFSVLVLKPFAEHLGLVDQPCDRKRHKGAIPLIGGLSVYLATLVSCVLAFPENPFVHWFLFLSGLIVMLGVLDDYLDLPVRLRLFVQVLIAAGLVYGANRYIYVLGDLFGIGAIDLGLAGIIFTVVAMLAAINAFNMVDGIDGLAGGLALNTFLSIAILMLLSDQTRLVGLPLILCVSLIPYLLFNLGLLPGPLPKIFMGDAGSMFIGFSVVCLLIVGTQSEAPAFRPVAALWIIAVPLMDMTCIVIRRLRKGESPFKADRDHLHHIIMRSGCGPRVALAGILYLSIVYSTIGIVGEYLKLPEWLMFSGFIVAFLFYLVGLVNNRYFAKSRVFRVAEQR
ncbi:Undecaprenyl-phosphate alpha-N-acetylglucosaminyl 1-phosphate transferase [BD1-7 clade bacterium]|uniref:Undecaprenyl-phosphate alpha-N-acetylglucosaminyl 1-phosphate transferase n=1 Tax=BD1-7 clade bacterium TaxID=2029982 RepID=A0A5S9N739_9GAMM|nr:Undecaprenyl-phosphate alpha-N-acetylglucosaminyl 1-phosphate transferase [BD1-7 clade bacterium]CAA0083853.1 Undecaprenyl-phosphate alpha-N-acetylglucosaminyl 1-phosphate transferase [BD1-7 clade bacterium]